MNILSGLIQGQVLQRLGSRGAQVRLMGKTSASGPVVATLFHRKSILKGWKPRTVGKSGRGKFQAELKGLPVGGPYRLELRAGGESVRCDFFVGDVWLMAGQSNMEGCGDMTAPAKPHPFIRLFSMRRAWRQAVEPLHLLNESPDACHHQGRQWSPEEGEAARRNALKGAGVGLYFAREMFRHSGVPQGLIATAHGGTTLVQWDPGLKDRGGDSLYGSMLLSLRANGQSLAGVLWYQGENEASAKDAPLYTDRMKKLVAACRRDLRQPRLPWIMVQLARVYGDNDAVNWNRVQEQQRQLPRQIRNLETVAAIDLPLDDGVHIGAAGFPRLAARLARAARHLISGAGQRPPQLRAIKPTKNSQSPAGPTIDVLFDSVEGNLRADGVPQGFTLVNAEGKVLPVIFKTTLHGKMVRLHCCRTLGPDLQLHYGHGLAPIANVTDGRDFSLPVFGPLPLFRPAAYLSFVTTWRTTKVLDAVKSLGKIACPSFDPLETTVKTYGAGWGLEGFINEHEQWQGRSGHAAFESMVQLEESMKLRILMGYDGPFRVWIDGRVLFEDLNGSNPCYADQSEKSFALAAGTHRLTVAMDLNGGRSWGFVLRFVREDVSPEQLEKNNYLRPSYFCPSSLHPNSSL